MQVLSTKGFEVEETPGLGWIEGEVKKINPKELPLPHIGWQNLNIKKNNKIIKDINDLDFYFVHSYALYARNEEEVIASAKYGEEFCSIIQKENIIGVQFHPEKSQQAGMKILQNFLSL